MLNLPSKFKSSLGNGRVTSLFPLVVIGSNVRLSIKSVNIDGDSYKPLLLSSPSIKSSADIINNKYTISSVSLSISNAIYQNKIFSDSLPSLLNETTKIYYCANGITSLDDCLLVYTGTLRRYSQSAETIKLSLEDLTEDTIKAKVPTTLIEDDTKYRQEDLGKPYPMIYGFVENAPLIFNNFKLDIDKPNLVIGGLWQEGQKIDYKNDYIATGHDLIDQNWLSASYFLSIYENGWIPIGIDIPIKFGSYEHNLPDKDLYFFNEGDSYNSSNIEIEQSAFLYEEYNESGEGLGSFGLPSRIYRPIKKVGVYARNNWDENPETENKMVGYQALYSIIHPYEHVAEIGESGALNDDSPYVTDYEEQYANGTRWAPTEITFNKSGGAEEYIEYEDTLRGGMHEGIFGSEFPVFWLQDGDRKTGLHMSAQNKHANPSNPPIETPAGGIFARLHLDEFTGSFKCITKILYDAYYWSPTNMHNNYSDNNGVHAEPSAFWIERQLILRKSLRSGNLVPNGNNLTTDSGDEGYSYWNFLSDTGTNHTYGMVPNHEHNFTVGELDPSDADPPNNSDPNFWIYNNDGGIFNFINGESDFDNRMRGFDNTNTYDSIQWGMPSLYSYHTAWTSTSSCIATLREVYVTQDCLIDELSSRKFYSNIKGRSNYDLISNVIPEIMTYDTNGNINSGGEYYISYITFETPHQMVVGDSFHFWDDNDQYIGKMTVFVVLNSYTLYVKDERLNGIVSGRTSFERTDGQLISRATDILENILTEELNYTGNIVRDDSGLEDEWMHSFALDEQKEAKQVFQDLFKSTITIPSFNSSGEFRFIPIHQKLSSSDINGFPTINVNDIIKYSFELTKLEDVYNQVNVKYKKNYGSGEFDAFTGYGVETNYGSNKGSYDSVSRFIYPNTPANQYNISYYGKTNTNSKLEVETEYVRDELTARRLQRRLLMWHCNQHLIVKLDLPPSYMHFEAGDYIKFEELIGGKKAFGYEYHQENSSDVGRVKNGQIVYNAFFITKISKSLTKVSIEAVQVHRGEVGLSDSDASSFILDNPYDLDIYAGDDVALAEEKFSIKWAQFKNNISMGPITAILDTPLEGDFDYTIWITSISADFRFAGQEFLAGDYEVGEISALDLVEHSKSGYGSGKGGMVTISKLAEIQNPLLELTFNLEITLDDRVANSEFFQTYVAARKPDLGDVNEDGIVNILDVVQIVQAIQSDQEDTLPEQADINEDGIYNIQDIVMIINYIFTGNWGGGDDQEGQDGGIS